MAAHRRDQRLEWNFYDQGRYTGTIATILELHALSFILFVFFFCFGYNELTHNFLVVCAFLHWFIIFKTAAYIHIEEPLPFHRHQLIKIDRVALIYCLICINFFSQIDIHSTWGQLTLAVLAFETINLYIYSLWERELHADYEGEALLMRLRL